MGIFDRFRKPTEGEYLTAEKIFKIVSGYRPAFTNWNGALYESELVRSAIDARARHISKLKFEVIGSAQPGLTAKLRRAPNELQTWSQFFYRASTILDCTNTLFVVPILGDYNNTLGYIPINPTSCELVRTEDGDLWLRYRFSNGQTGAIEWNRVFTMTKHQYKSDFFGDSNHALYETMNLIHMQNQGIEEGVKGAANIQFIARLTNFAKAADLKKEQQRFNENHLRAGNDGGVLLFPNTYDDIQQVNYKPFTVDAEQMKLIQTNIYNYFGVNEDILQNKAFGDTWSAFYEGAVEPFAIQFSEGMTKTIFTDREQAQGNQIMATSNRLQYLSNKDKLEVSAQMADRGIMTRNEIREIWNLPPIDGFDEPIRRGEYVTESEKGNNDDE